MARPLSFYDGAYSLRGEIRQIEGMSNTHFSGYPFYNTRVGSERDIPECKQACRYKEIMGGITCDKCATKHPANDKEGCPPPHTPAYNSFCPSRCGPVCDGYWYSKLNLPLTFQPKVWASGTYGTRVDDIPLNQERVVRALRMEKKSGYATLMR